MFESSSFLFPFSYVLYFISHSFAVLGELPQRVSGSPWGWYPVRRVSQSSMFNTEVSKPLSLMSLTTHPKKGSKVSAINSHQEELVQCWSRGYLSFRVSQYSSKFPDHYIWAQCSEGIAACVHIELMITVTFWTEKKGSGGESKHTVSFCAGNRGRTKMCLSCWQNTSQAREDRKDKRLH